MKLKICGLYRNEDIAAINKYPCDYIGFVFYPKSHRYVTFDQAKKLRDQLQVDCKVVGVFVDEYLSYLKQLIDQNIIDVVQLHGNEDNNYIAELRKFHSGEIIKAINITDQDDFNNLDYNVDYYLLDSANFGSGKKFDWSWIKKLNKPYFLAGGINLSNLEEAIKYGDYGIDLSSGIETGKQKDINKIKEIVGVFYGKR